MSYTVICQSFSNNKTNNERTFEVNLKYTTNLPTKANFFIFSLTYHYTGIKYINNLIFCVIMYIMEDL